MFQGYDSHFLQGFNKIRAVQQSMQAAAKGAEQQIASFDKKIISKLKEAEKEFKETYKKISLNMSQIEFQREVGRLEVLGELLIKNKK